LRISDEDISRGIGNKAHRVNAIGRGVASVAIISPAVAGHCIDSAIGNRYFPDAVVELLADIQFILF
jgi:hypothetical protein